MRLGLIARCDRGGLAAQTYELWRHLKPDKTLVLDVESSRGPSEPGKITDEHGEVRVCRGFPARREWQWLTSHIDVILTVETPYASALCSFAARTKTRVVVQANPELFDPRECPDSIVILPTSWESHRVEGATVLPLPVPTDMLPYRHRDGVRTFVHQWAPAFHDRNGTEVLLAALPSITVPCNLIVRGPAKLKLPARVGHVEVVHDRRQYANYWEGWPEEADCLVLPRRFGGLSLPMMEAAALGMPIITTDLAPQNEWVPRPGLVKVKPGPHYVRMKGGQFPVWDVDPVALALAMDRMVRDNEQASFCSHASRLYARCNSWAWMLPEYEKFLASTL